MTSLFSSSQSSRGARVSRKLHLLALAVASIRPASAITLSGCYSSSKPLSYSARWNFQSPSWCNTNCAGSAVFGLEGGYNCWCGSELPPADTQVDASNCDVGCTGYGSDMCGGTNFYTVYITGTDPSVGHYEPSNGGGNNNGNDGGSSSPVSSNTPTPSSTPVYTSSTVPQSSSAPASTTTQTSTATTIKHHKPSIVTKVRPGKTIVETVGPSTTASGAPTSNDRSSNSSGGGGTSVAGIAAGVSVGVVALAAIVGGVFYWLRRRRQRSEGAFDRSNRIGEFIRGPNGDSMPPPSTAHSQMSDSRLEPQWGNNRSSVGSFMDDQDYSRRILRVANPDSG